MNAKTNSRQGQTTGLTAERQKSCFPAVFLAFVSRDETMKQPNLSRKLCAAWMIQHFFVAGIALAAAGVIVGCARLRPVEKSAQIPVTTPVVIPRPVKLVPQAGHLDRKS